MKKIIIDDENFKTEYSTKICQRSRNTRKRDRSKQDRLISFPNRCTADVTPRKGANGVRGSP